ncbi:MAG: aminotransferase class IV [Planctomycetota bacterium]
MGNEADTQVAWQAGKWVDPPSLRLPLEDLGALQGVSVVDRVRTGVGQPIDLLWHLERFRSGAESLGITLEVDLERLCLECIERRRAMRSSEDSIGDFSLILYATPGVSQSGTTKSAPANLMLYTVDLPIERMRNFYEHGQELVSVERTLVPSNSWSAQIKTRSRLHYYLGEQEANALVTGAGAVLSTQDGGLGDTSLANLVVVKDDTLFVAPETDVLHGVTLRRILQLSRNDYSSLMQPITRELAFSAEAILCTGTTALLWPVRSLSYMAGSQLEQREWCRAGHNPAYQLLCKRLEEWLGYDYRKPFASPKQS